MQEVDRKKYWIGIGSLLAAPVLFGGVFPLVANVIAALFRLSWVGPFSAEGVAIFALWVATIGALVYLCIWQARWAARIVRWQVATNPRRGFSLLGIGLYALSLSTFYATTSFASDWYAEEFPREPLHLILTWIPAAGIAIASGVALSRSGSKWLGIWYILYVPLTVVSLHILAINTHRQAAFCAPFYLPALQLPWVLTGLIFAAAALLMTSAMIWSELNLGWRIGLSALAIGFPLTILGALFMYGPAMPGVTDCGGPQWALTHLIGPFYW